MAAGHSAGVVSSSSRVPACGGRWHPVSPHAPQMGSGSPGALGSTGYSWAVLNAQYVHGWGSRSSAWSGPGWVPWGAGAAQQRSQDPKGTEMGKGRHWGRGGSALSTGGTHRPGAEQPALGLTVPLHCPNQPFLSTPWSSCGHLLPPDTGSTWPSVETLQQALRLWPSPEGTVVGWWDAEGLGHSGCGGVSAVALGGVGLGSGRVCLKAAALVRGLARRQLGSNDP